MIGIEMRLCPQGKNRKYLEHVSAGQVCKMMNSEIYQLSVKFTCVFEGV
jgi:hypothetical protein